MITIRDHLEDMGESPGSIEYLLEHRELIPGYTPANPPATNTGD